MGKGKVKILRTRLPPYLLPYLAEADIHTQKVYSKETKINCDQKKIINKGVSC
jgi:hypothetical protein